MKFAWCDVFLVGVGILGGCLFTGCGGNDNEPSYEYLPSVNMFLSSGVKNQRKDPLGVAGRTPPAGTIAVDYQPYLYKGDPEGAKKLKNPLPRTHAVLMRGQKLFNTYCIVCHGPRGEGNGYVVPKFPAPPSLQSDKVRGWPDGSIYHVITEGQNRMWSYATQIEPSDRWAIIHYVRVLQKSMNPTDQDMQGYKKAKGN